MEVSARLKKSIPNIAPKGKLEHFERFAYLTNIIKPHTNKITYMNLTFIRVHDVDSCVLEYLLKLKKYSKISNVIVDNAKLFALCLIFTHFLT